MSEISKQLFLDKLAVKADIASYLPEVRRAFTGIHTPGAQDMLFKEFNRASKVLKANRLAARLRDVDRRFNVSMADIHLKKLRGVSVDPAEIAAVTNAAARERQLIRSSFPDYSKYVDPTIRYKAAEPWLKQNNSIPIFKGSKQPIMASLVTKANLDLPAAMPVAPLP